MIMPCNGVGLSAPVITLSLRERLNWRDVHAYSDELLSARRFEFGGHEEKPADE